MRYLVTEGVHWASLPADDPKWRAVYRFFRRWRDNDLIKELYGQLRTMLRSRSHGGTGPGARGRSLPAQMPDAHGLQDLLRAGVDLPRLVETGVDYPTPHLITAVLTGLHLALRAGDSQTDPQCLSNSDLFFGGIHRNKRGRSLAAPAGLPANPVAGSRPNLASFPGGPRVSAERRHARTYVHS
ncbi:transposase [Streptacidiphilus cavernicola]|uniref:Transposase n=1 Tax=Streptacidiphilus cavernicola TaxID=3342716 RepID=A0ABV6VP17_9ACTN